MRVYSLIPARSGSKGVPHKNIYPLRGHPLIAWSIVASLETSLVDRTFVSTDSVEYARIAERYGAEVPFLRPTELSQDASRDVEFLLHILEWWSENGIPAPDFLLLLRPTTPLRESVMLDAAIEKIMAAPHATSLCSGFELPESPVKNFVLDDDGIFHGFISDAYLSLPRQECPKAYAWDGYVDILRPDRISNFPDDIYGSKRLAMLTPPGREIDASEDIEFIEFILQKREHPLLESLDKKVEMYGK
jgi:CMP-N-acetylneuraminic acid synthetase